jgi:hypothetical protein
LIIYLLVWVFLMIYEVPTQTLTKDAILTRKHW